MPGCHACLANHLAPTRHALTDAASFVRSLFVNELFVDAGVQACQALAHNNVLKSLDLQQGQIGVPGGKVLGQVLATNNSLMNLKLHYNHLGPEGTRHICEGLKKNKRLTNLDLGDNGIMQAGVDALAEMLQVNTCLFRLDCSKNAGLTSKTGVPNDAAAKAILTKAGEAHEAKRRAAPKATAHDKLPFRLIMEDSPGQMWSPHGFVNKVKFPQQRRPKSLEDQYA